MNCILTKRKDLINAFCKICNVYMSCLVWYFVKFSFSLSLWRLAIPLYCVYVCVDLIKNLIKVRFRLFLVVSPRIVVQGFQQSFHGNNNNEQEYLLFHSYPIAIVTKHMNCLCKLLDSTDKKLALIINSPNRSPSIISLYWYLTCSLHEFKLASS